MSKHTIPLADECPPLRRSRLRTALVLATTVVLMPLIVDSTKVCVARWQAMYGAVPTIQTPALDLVTSIVVDLRRESHQAAEHVFRRLPWRADLVVITLSLCALAACGFLRR